MSDNKTPAPAPNTEEKKEEELSEHLAVNPEVHKGKPCLTGTRVSVEQVQARAKEGMDVKELMEFFPGTTKEAIEAALAYGKAPKK